MPGHEKASASAASAVASGARYDDKIRARAVDLRKRKWTIARISRELGPNGPDERTLRRWFKQEELPRASKLRHNHEAIMQELRRAPKIPAKQVARKFRCGVATVYAIRKRMLAEGQTT